MTTKTSLSPVKYAHGKNPNSLKNLKPFLKGEKHINHNPDGNSLKAVLLSALGKPLKEPAKDAPARDHVVYTTLVGAILCEPSSAHLKEVWDRVEGKLQDKEPLRIDNRAINIYIQGEEARKNLERLLAGEKPQGEIVNGEVLKEGSQDGREAERTGEIKEAETA